MNETKNAPPAKPEKNKVNTSTSLACLPITDIAEINPATIKSRNPIKDIFCLVFNGSSFSLCSNHGKWRRDYHFPYRCDLLYSLKMSRQPFLIAPLISYIYPIPHSRMLYSLSHSMIFLKLIEATMNMITSNAIMATESRRR